MIGTLTIILFVTLTSSFGLSKEEKRKRKYVEKRKGKENM